MSVSILSIVSSQLTECVVFAAAAIYASMLVIHRLPDFCLHDRALYWALNGAFWPAMALMFVLIHIDESGPTFAQILIIFTLSKLVLASVCSMATFIVKRKFIDDYVRPGSERRKKLFGSGYRN